MGQIFVFTSAPLRPLPRSAQAGMLWGVLSKIGIQLQRVPSLLSLEEIGALL